MPRNKHNQRAPLVGGVHGVRVGSLHHEVLLVLEHSALSCAEIGQALAVRVRPSAAVLTPESLRKRALVPLREAGMLTHERTAQTWSANTAGRTMLRALEDHEAGVSTDTDSTPTPSTRRAPAARKADAASTATSSAGQWDGTAARDGAWLDAYATKGQPRRGLGNADRRPPVVRAGADAAARLPSRIGQRLEWPDGRQASASAADAATTSGTAATR